MNSNESINLNNYSVSYEFDRNSNDFIIGEPFHADRSFEYNKSSTNFVLYEDFPIKKTLNSESHLRFENLPENTWAKIVVSNNKHNSTFSDTFLRIMGAIKPFQPNPFNNTFFVMAPVNKNVYQVRSIPLLKNGIIMEVSTVGDSHPIKYKHELFIRNNSTTLSLFGVVYDDPISGIINMGENESKTIALNITPLGLIQNGTLTPFPDWLEVKVLRLPLTLTLDQPDYYVLLISTVKAPPGSYEIGLSENISQNKYIEAITVTIVNR